MTDNDIDILARTIYGEARNQGILGMEAVGCVVMNRLKVAQNKENCWWGKSVVEICQKPFQFSCWNKNDPNRDKILKVDLDDKVFAAAVEIAEKLLEGKIPDVTGGATSYHTKTSYPSWSQDMVQTKIIRDHIFYK